MNKYYFKIEFETDENNQALKDIINDSQEMVKNAKKTGTDIKNIKLVDLTNSKTLLEIQQ